MSPKNSIFRLWTYACVCNLSVLCMCIREVHIKTAAWVCTCAERVCSVIVSVQGPGDRQHPTSLPIPAACPAGDRHSQHHLHLIKAQDLHFTLYWQFLSSSWFSQLVLTSWICEEDGGDSGTHGGCPWQLDVRRRPRGGRSRGWRCSNGHTHTSPSILCSDWDCAWLPANPTMRASTPRAARALRAATILTTAAKAGLVASQLHNVPPLPLAHQVLTAAGLIARPTAWPRLTLRTLTNRKAGPAVSR